jgi:hypothetical protein
MGIFTTACSVENEPEEGETRLFSNGKTELSMIFVQAASMSKKTLKTDMGFSKSGSF